MGHAGEMAAWQAVTDQLQSGASRHRIFSQFQLPISEPMEGNGHLWRGGSWLFAELKNRAFRFRQIVEVIGIQLCQYHPALEIVYAFFNIMANFAICIGYFAEINFL